jgi:hypothetical protein
VWSESRDHLRLPCQVWIKEIETMNKFHKLVTALTVICAVGLTFGVLALKGIPETFDWEEDDE